MANLGFQAPDDSFVVFKARVPKLEDFDKPVYDGDTLWLECDFSNFLRHEHDIRLRNVHAPEIRPLQTGAVETRQFVLDWVNRWNVGKWPFWVYSYQTSTYRDLTTLERFVCDVFNKDATSCLNTEVERFIIENGYPPGN